MVLAKCACGTTKLVNRSHLLAGRSKSCGCYNLEVLRARVTRHGHSVNGKSTTTFNIWMGMFARCHSPTSPAYKRYGGRGIKVCRRWNKFENFLSDMGERPSRAHSLDRINNDGGYSPSNCRWATRAQQNRNRSNNQWLTIDGKTAIITDWAVATGVGDGTIRWRLAHGWSPEKAIRPVTVRRLTDDDVNQIRLALARGASYVDVAAKFGIDRTTVCRIKLGRIHPTPKMPKGASPSGGAA